VKTREALQAIARSVLERYSKGKGEGKSGEQIEKRGGGQGGRETGGG